MQVSVPNWDYEFIGVSGRRLPPSEFLAALKLTTPNELPYRDPTGLIWLHDINKKGTAVL
jgi:hypothetical protein